MNGPLINNANTWSRLAALVVLLTKVMGASQWSWTLSLSAVAVLVGLPWLAGWVRAKLTPKPEPSLNGGDIILTPGAPAIGGTPGRIVLRGFARSEAPFLSLEQVDSPERLDVYVGAYDPAWLKVKDGSVFIQLDDLKILRHQAGAWSELNRPTTHGDGT
jgi:hypothetical protein